MRLSRRSTARPHAASLAVHPFAGLVNEVPAGTPRLLINRERVGEQSTLGPRGLDFDSESDAFFQGDCDDAVHGLCSLLGWEAEMRAVLEAAQPPSAKV